MVMLCLLVDPQLAIEAHCTVRCTQTGVTATWARQFLSHPIGSSVGVNDVQKPSFKANGQKLEDSMHGHVTRPQMNSCG